MTYSFAALRFFGDKNISDRIYWYLTGIPLKIGDSVLAPVGMHDRLQLARVEKTLSASGEDAPYDVRLLKSVEAMHGARKLVADGTELLEFGGVRYDEKHFTPFGRLLLAKELPQALDELKDYGVTDILGEEEDDPYEKIANARGCVVAVGKGGEEVFKSLLEFVRGINKPLYDIGVTTQQLAHLKEKLL